MAQRPACASIEAGLAVDVDSVTSRSLNGAGGGHVRAVSKVLAERYGVRHAVLVDHGSTAIRASLWAMRHIAGDTSMTVGVPCNVWRGVYSAVGFSGAGQLLLADVDGESGVLVGGPHLERCDVIVAVDGYAKRCHVEGLGALGCPVIEDSSLSQRPSRNSGGDLAATVCVLSLQSNKLLSCGEGGVVLTDDGAIAALIEASVCDGRAWLDVLGEKPVLMGFNGMMSNAVAGRLVAQLAAHDEYLRRVAAGARIAIGLAGKGAIPGWIDEDLLSTGELFALPIRHSRSGALLREGVLLGAPPLPPDERLKSALRTLPITVIAECPFDGARDFAAAHALLPHWDLAELAREHDVG